MPVKVVILAAGQGKRMRSSLHKVLQPLAGKPLIKHVIHTVSRVVDTPPIIVYGHQGERLKEALTGVNVFFVEQKLLLGTGHALLQALPMIAEDDQVLVLCGDVPLIAEETLKKLLETTPPGALGMLTADVSIPTGYGRIKRDAEHRIVSIIEEKDASPAERTIQEINPSIYFVPANFLKKWLPLLSKQNAQGEYYLTDIIAKAAQENIPIHSVKPTTHEEILGVNDHVQLAHLERYYQYHLAEKWMRQGVTFYDPKRIDIRGDVEIGSDVIIDINVILEGRVVIGDGCIIGANVILKDAVLENGVEIKPNSVIDGARIAEKCVLGPFARIRPDTVLGKNVHIGNFVEIKKSVLGEATKVNHLSYVGDSEVGSRVNIGAGTITCNYDGANKHKTIIGDDVHIGSDTQLVAPVYIGQGATIGAGSTVTKNAPPHQLTLTHKLEQRAIDGWKKPIKEEH